MEQGKQIVVVAGATGRTGKLIVEELVARGYQVRAMVRSAAQAYVLQREGVELAEGDLTSVDSLEKIMEGAQYLISAIGSKKPFNKEENNRVDNMGNQTGKRCATHGSYLLHRRGQ
ncbi:MAG: NAD(P)H-binding protein [Proteobacteria bacterium]|nr:NAD(P)H-binding protein [Pseudomonadota bacterium]